MQYFVSAENSSYFYWQLELLIESFLMHGMEKNLVIGLAENDSSKIKGYSKNLVKYGEKFIHSNEGKKLNYLPLNRANSIRYALAYKILKFPFVLIHADMLLRNPINLSEDDSKFGVVVNNFEETSAVERKSIQEAIKPEIERIAEDRKLDVKSFPEIPSFSAPVVFNESFEYIWDVFFSKLQSNTLNFIEKKGKEFPCERAAWEQTLMESFQHCAVKGSFMSAPLMFEDDNVNFIHYKTGIPPVFNKKFFKFENGIFNGSGTGPFETVLEHNPTVNTNYMHQVIRSYIRRNK